MDPLSPLLSLLDRASGRSRSPKSQGSERRTASTLHQQGGWKLKLFQVWGYKKAMKLDVSLLTANKKNGQIAIWVTFRLQWGRREHYNQKLGVLYVCK